MSYKDTKSYEAFMQSPYRSIKHKSYFDVYDNLLEEYVGRNITFVEVGVLDGGSLFMWREFFGDKARIIGIEINESAKVWEDYGFEIFIGSQSDPKFWQGFYNEVGKVDILLDDGGHTYQQQIVTVESSLENIRPGGKIIVEDTYTSYQKEYGYPSNYSFVKYASNLADGMNLRTPKIKTKKKTSNVISNVSFFESIVAIGVNSSDNLLSAEGIPNNGLILGKQADSLRYADKPKLTKVTGLIASVKFLQTVPIIGSVLKTMGILLSNTLRKVNNKLDNFKLRRYFKH